MSTISLNKDVKIFELAPETTRAQTTTSTTTLKPKTNKCTDQTSKWVNITAMRQSPVSSKYSLVFEKVILAMVEICVPEIYYIVHFEDEIILIEDNNFMKKNTFKSIIPKQNVNKIRIVATKDRIIITDNTDYLHIYNLDMEFINSLNINDRLRPIKLGAMFYDAINDQLLVHEIGSGIRVLDTKQFRLADRLPVIVNENIFMQKLGNNSIFFTSISGEVGKYDTINRQKSSLNVTICNLKQKVIAFFVQSDYNIISVTTLERKTANETIEYSRMRDIKSDLELASKLIISSLLINSNGQLITSLINDKGNQFEIQCCSFELYKVDDENNGYATKSKNFLLINTCTDTTARLSNFISNRNLIPQSVFISEREIQEFIQVCLPEVFFILHLGDRIIKLDKNFRGQYFINFDRDVALVAGRNKMIALDEFGSFSVYNYNLDYIKSITLPEIFETLTQDVLFGKNLNFKFMFYDFQNDQFLVHNPYRGFYVLDNELKLVKTFYLEIGSSVVFSKPSNAFIYFVMSNNSIGRLDIVNQRLLIQKPICSKDKPVVSLIADENNTLLTVCSNRKSSEIIISQFGFEKPIRKIETIDYIISNVMIDAAGQLIASFKKSNKFGLLVTSLDSLAKINA